MNNTVTRLTGAKPVNAIKEKAADSKPSSNYARRPVGFKEKQLDYYFNLRDLLAPGELEGGQKRATDPIWSLKVYNIQSSVVKEGDPVLHYLKNGAASADVSAATPKRGFVREELMITPKDTEKTPAINA